MASFYFLASLMYPSIINFCSNMLNAIPHKIGANGNFALNNMTLIMDVIDLRFIFIETNKPIYKEKH